MSLPLRGGGPGKHAVVEAISPTLTESFAGIVLCTWKYEYSLFLLIVRGSRYNEVNTFDDDKWAKVQVYSLAIVFRMWSRPHYRSVSFQQDMIANLRNVAIPGTGIPLSIFCVHWLVALFFVLMVNPLVCYLGACNKAWKHRHGKDWEEMAAMVEKLYLQHLLHPDDWFSFWRLNSRLVSYHSMLKGTSGYLQEDKWTFLTSGQALGVPVSPFSDVEAIVVKNKNIEGGMGIHFFKNAMHGGDWIIQERLRNAPWLNALLPPNAPLSTLRVITTSIRSLSTHTAGVNTCSTAVAVGADLVWRDSFATTNGTTSPCASQQGDSLGKTDNREEDDEEEEDASKFVSAISAVLRLGREGAATDHSSVLFNVDVTTGLIEGGTSNSHWYKLGLRNALKCPWLPPSDGFLAHPDSPCPVVSGQRIPDWEEAIRVVTESHFKMMADVPIVGWDVAFTDKGVFLLEVNLSCNFFRGTFDIPEYISFVDAFWSELSPVDPYRGPRLKDLFILDTLGYFGGPSNAGSSRGVLGVLMALLGWVVTPADPQKSSEKSSKLVPTTDTCVATGTKVDSGAFSSSSGDSKKIIQVAEGKRQHTKSQ